MRKKSHISLARYLVWKSKDQDLKKHRYSFYIGSILPDVKPSFLYKKHEMNGTFGDLKETIARLTDAKGKKQVKRKSKYYRNLGQVTHYLADYFTYPHNKVFPGNLAEHCSYEEKLKLGLRKYLKEKRERAEKESEGKGNFQSLQAMFDYIQGTHDEYLKKKINVEEDMEHIVQVNHRVVSGIENLFHSTQNHFHK